MEEDRDVTLIRGQDAGARQKERNLDLDVLHPDMSEF